MKHAIRCTLVAIFGVFVVIYFVGKLESVGFAQTMPDTIILGKDAKLGQVTFNHTAHNSGAYSVSGTGPVACIECHHTAQPAAEAAKHPPHKTAWPADRTTTLTEDLFKQDPKAAGVAACRDCHARAGMTPKLLPAIPKTTVELTNQQAFHKTCTGCHAEVKKNKPDSKAPTATQCTMCHKKAT